MKIFNREIHPTVLIVAGAVLIGIFIITFLSIPSCQKQPSSPQALLDEALAVAQKPLLDQIANQNAQISDYRSKLTISHDKYTVMANRYIALQKEKENVKPPETNMEIRSRFTALGYPPLPAK
jgi:hypothetical protein